MTKESKAQYKRLLAEAIQSNDTIRQRFVKHHIERKYGLNEFYGIECEVLEDLGQSQSF